MSPSVVRPRRVLSRPGYGMARDTQRGRGRWSYAGLRHNWPRVCPRGHRFWGIGHSGAQGIGGNLPDTIQPGIFFGKGLGDLPDSLAWLRPFAITGAVTAELPTNRTATNLGIDASTGLLASMQTTHVEMLHWGFSIQYSTLYLTERLKPGRLPKDAGPPHTSHSMAAYLKPAQSS